MGKNYDADLAAMLTNLSNDKALDNTFLILMGDHGYRTKGFASLPQGNIENNMPVLLIIPPKDHAPPSQSKSAAPSISPVFIDQEGREGENKVCQDDQGKADPIVITPPFSAKKS